MVKKDFDAHSFLMTHAQTDRWLRTNFAQALEATDLTMMEWLLLTTLSKYGDEGQTVTEVAEQMAVSLPQITALTQELQKKGLIEQQTERQDRRSRRLLITAKGKTICDEGCDAVNTALGHLSTSPQLRSYKQFLSHLVDQVDQPAAA
jgi:DNA-binding MarR family transcriptional regulator